MSVVAVCRDLFFTSRIGQTGKLVGTHALAQATQPWHGRCDRVVTKETLTQELADILAHGLAARPRS